MSEKKETSPFFEDLYSQWMKAGMKTWEPMTRMWTDTAKTLFGSKMPSGISKEKTRWQSSIEASASSFQALLSAMGDSTSSDALFKGFSAFPQVWMKIAHTGLQAFSSLQKLMTEKAGRIHESTQAYQFENLDENVFKIWADVYEKEVKPFIRIPQIGPARFYQERFNEALDAFNRFQTAAGEFFRLLYLPVEKSLRVLQEEMKSKAETGDLPKSSRDFYQRWVKILEGHYMTLFKSEEYVEIMGKTLAAMEGFLEKKNRLASDWARSLSLPTQEEMDALYKEIYLLKKRMRSLEKSEPAG